jgi:hypothetical protein
MQTTQLSHLLVRPAFASLPPSAAQLVMALRVFVIARRREVEPVPVLTERLGCLARARLAVHIAGVVGYVWPERFTLSPPCCGSLSHDEQLLGELAAWAAAGNRPRFDAAGCDLLGDEARDQLWREFTRWG